MDRIGNHSQVGMPFLAVVKPPHRVPDDVLPRITDTGAMRYAAQLTGQDDYEIADKIGVSHGYMSKILKGTASLSGKRLVKFMRETNSIAPLQWLAHQMGCELVVMDKRAAEVAALKARLEELERAA